MMAGLHPVLYDNISAALFARPLYRLSPVAALVRYPGWPSPCGYARPEPERNHLKAGILEYRNQKHIKHMYIVCAYAVYLYYRYYKSTLRHFTNLK